MLPRKRGLLAAFLLATLLLLSFPISHVYAVLSVIDSFAGPGATNIIFQAPHPSTDASISMAGQSFTGNGMVLNVSSFQMLKSNLPNCTLKSALYAHTGTFGFNSTPNLLYSRKNAYNFIA